LRGIEFINTMSNLKRHPFSLILIILIYGTGSIPSAQTRSQYQPRLERFELLTASSGWVLLDKSLFWTSDAGKTWDEIGPSFPVDAAVQDVEFIDSNSGWILSTTNNEDGSSNFTIIHTTDHGASWSATTPQLFESGEIPAHSEKADMGWLDVQSGWIAVKQSSSSNFSLGTLFTTSDGGNTWARFTLPVADRVFFSEPLIGWAVGGATGDQLFKTKDGGITWQNKRPDLPMNQPATIYTPFYSGGSGILVVTVLSANDSLDLHVFNESPDEWLPRGHVTLNAQPGIIGLSIIDTHNFVAGIPGTNSIVRMRNGIIETLENQDGNASSITALDMISLDHGWAKSVDSKCVTAPALDDGSGSVSCTSHTRLLQTRDGGLTWQDISLPLVQSNTISPNGIETDRSMAMNVLPNLGNTNIFVGQGFDKCEIPTFSQMQNWSVNSPYKVVNLYIGGSNRACTNSALTDSYLYQLSKQGWKFIPTWVGPQAPCTGYLSRMSSDPVTAYNQGVNEANLAVDRLDELGLTYPDKTGSVVYYDIEYYGTNAACRDAVKAFMNGWVSQIHAHGNLAGAYGSTLCNTGLSDFMAITNVPDVIWPARWYHNIGQGYYDPAATVWNLGSCIPNTVWADHQRIRQYEGDHDETWGGLTLAIDSNVLDGVVAIPFMDPTKIFFQEVASGLNNPVFITNAGDGSGRMFVVERGGRIRIIKNGSLLATPYLDIQSLVKSTDSEQGLLGLAFHPAYGSNGKFYVVYTAPRTGDSNGSVLTLRQYSVSVGNPDIANPNGSTIVLTIDHPTYSNHNGGTITFGNDGYLYWSTGDGGSGGDPNNNGQNLNSLLGKILRIDMNSTSPYGIPPSNPFYSSSNPNIKKEIWSYGLRNPWRISFDRVTHDLYIGDVGQSAREEIDFQASSSTGGENYGWRVMEGSLCYNPGSGCDQTGKVLPVAEYDHTLGCSITGGYMYRGSDYPTLYGHYLYGDYCSGRLFSLRNNPGSVWESVQLLDTPYNISTFGEDEQGGLYLADYATGKIYNVGYMEEGFLYSNRKIVDFGGQLYYIKSDPLRTTLTNYQATDVHMGSFVRSSGQFLLSNNTCAGAILAPSQSCTFDLQFKPTAYGALSGTLAINSDATNDPVVISLAGVGLSGTQLVTQGGSFEQDNDNNGIPDFWNTTGLTALDGQSNQYAKHGTYSMKIVGQAGATKTLKKTILKNGSAGDDFLFVLWSKAEDVPDGFYYRTQISFYNGATLVEQRIKDYTSGTHDWEYRWLPITVIGDYTRIEVEIIYSLASGTAWFDSNSLKWAP
jgi:glucose/arabinose dehydrogenase/photosystem II stability/assembly factor-like uncharacterized protein